MGSFSTCDEEGSGYLWCTMRRVGDRPYRRSAIRRSCLVALTTVLVGTLSVLSAPIASANGGVPLVGTFRITAGACNPVSGTITGSWFKLIFPHGNTSTGFFFPNSSSLCFNKGYTTLSPGTQGGLVSGSFQPGPSRAFDKKGDARASAIIRPVPFATIDLSLSTQSTDPQTRKPVPAPVILQKGDKLSGNTTALSAAWKRIYINQGSPKPAGRRPGLTLPVSGRYNARTRAFSLTWTSQIVGGPFTGFIGYWHLVGTFVPAR